MRIYPALIVAILIWTSCSSPDDSSFLEIRDNAIISTHALPFLLEKPEGFMTSVPVTHYPSFNDHPFKVSLAGYFKTDEALFVHAEQVLDASGVLNYTDLPRDTLSGHVFGVRSLCAELEPVEISEEHDLRYIRDNGFNLMTAAYLKQYLMSSDDFNFEYIISYAVNVDSCAIPDEDPQWEDRINDRIKSLVLLKSL